jgi:hypothetical protein
MRAELQTAVDTLKTQQTEAIEQLAQLHAEELALAGVVLMNVGMRLMELEGGTTSGLWSDLDSAEVRAALRVFGSHLLPVRYLDGPGVALRYKERRVEGEPVPMNVLAEMERAQAKVAQAGDDGIPAKTPWSVRDRLLREMNWHPQSNQQGC